MTSHVWQCVRAHTEHQGLTEWQQQLQHYASRTDVHVCVHLLVIWQEVIGCNDVLVELLDDSVPVDAGLACISSTSPP